MHLLAFCINFMGLIGCYSNQSHPLMLNLSERTFWKLISHAKLPAELKKKITMRKAHAMNFKGLNSSSCSGHSALMQLRLLYYLVSNQVSMQEASKPVENFPPKISIYYSETTQLVRRKINYSAMHHLVLLNATDQYTQLT